MKNNDFVHLGTKFQENLCQIMLEDRSYCDQILEVLDIKYFEKQYMQSFIQIIIDYKKKFKGAHPTHGTLAHYVKTGVLSHDKALQKQVIEFFVKISQEDNAIENPEYVKDHALNFFKKQRLKEALMQSVKLIKTSSFDEVQKLIEDALKLGTDNNFGHDYLKDFEERFLVQARNPISTGWKRLDEITKGGHGSRELGVVIAPTGAGKSMVLVHLGSQALKQGKTVVHYTLELADRVVGSRYDSCLSGVHLQDLRANKDRIFDVVKDVEGHLIIKEYHTKSASTATIKNHLNKLKKRGIDPDLIIVDYADLLKPVRNDREKRHELENIYENLRAIAQEFDCPLWTASQTNRSGLNAEVITMESISEAFNKCFVADFIFSLSRTVQDKQANKGRLFIAKNRNGPDGIVFPAFVDWSNITMKILNRTDADEESGTLGISTKDTLNYLKSQYAKMGSK